MQEMSSTVRAVAESCVAKVSGVEALPHNLEEVAFEENLQKDEVRSEASHRHRYFVVWRLNCTLQEMFHV